jgi:hypothetical protein
LELSEKEDENVTETVLEHCKFSSDFRRFFEVPSKISIPQTIYVYGIVSRAGHLPIVGRMA